MPTPRIYRTEALILKAFDLGEADRILTLFTPHLGKIRTIAKGVRRTKSRKAGHVDLFMRTNLLVAVGRDLDIVTQAEVVEPFRDVRDDLYRTACGYYLAELVDAFSADRMPNFPLYGATVTAFRRLQNLADLELVIRAFEIDLLRVSGYRPQLFRCLSCGNEIQATVNRFSAKMGGVLCPECSASDAGAGPISVAALKVLRNLQANEEEMVNVRGLEPSIGREVERHLQDYIGYRLESRPRSLRFLERLRVEGVRP